MFLPKSYHYVSGLLLALITLSSVASGNARETFADNLNQLLMEHNLPGVVVHIKHRQELVLHRAFGVINVDKPVALETDDIFRIYSMTKPITAVALLQLVDRGLVELHADIRTYLPEFSAFEFEGKQRNITIHQLLTHTAGFGYGGGLRNWVDIRYLLANPLSRHNTLAEMVDDLSGIDLKFAPGDKFEYSIASDIQGAIIETVTRQPLDQYFQDNLFTPLGMKDTGFFVPDSQRHRLVDMYEYDAGTFEQAYVFNKEKILFVESGEDSEYLQKPTLLSGGGGLVSTASDYANFVQMLLNKGEFSGNTILSQPLTRTMLSSHTQGLDTHFLPRVYDDVGFGYGVGVKEGNGDIRSQGSFFWGGMGGTIFWADPISQLQVVVMFQVEDGWIGIERWMIQQVYDLIGQLLQDQEQT